MKLIEVPENEFNWLESWYEINKKRRVEEKHNFIFSRRRQNLVPDIEVDCVPAVKLYRLIMLHCSSTYRFLYLFRRCCLKWNLKIKCYSNQIKQHSTRKSTLFMFGHMGSLSIVGTSWRDRRCLVRSVNVKPVKIKESLSLLKFLNFPRNFHIFFFHKKLLPIVTNTIKKNQQNRSSRCRVLR